MATELSFAGSQRPLRFDGYPRGVRLAKEEVFRDFLGERAFVHINAQVDGVIVPASSAGHSHLVLELDADTQELHFDSEGFTCNVLADSHGCRFPWDAVFAIVGGDTERGIAWLSDVPDGMLTHSDGKPVRAAIDVGLPEIRKHALLRRGEGSGEAPQAITLCDVGEAQVATVLPWTDIVSEGGFQLLAAVGRFQPPAAVGAQMGPDGFEENPRFVAFLQEVIARHGAADPGLQTSRLVRR